MSDYFVEIKLQLEPVRELAFGGITGAYAPIGTPLTNPSRVLYIKNSTNADLYISTDGVTNMKHVIATNSDILDCRTNIGCWPAYTQFYVKAVTASPTSGYIIIESVYAMSVANP
jgi:hypothetical protein